MPRATGRDIAEIFGFSPDDTSQQAASNWKNSFCPFIDSKCTKTNHDKSIIYGACSVKNTTIRKSPAIEAIICPKRLYANDYQTIRDVSSTAFGNIPLIIGGSIDDLKRNVVSNRGDCVVAFGQGSGKEIQVTLGGQLSMDWILQKYSPSSLGIFKPSGFIGIEVQSIDITGNYRDNWEAYFGLHRGSVVKAIPDSGHGMNWANVHKRLIPQIIRKGNIYKKCETCKGFFFIVPDIVFQKFEQILGKIEEQESFSKDNISVFTFNLGKIVDHGSQRSLVRERIVHYSVEDVAKALFSL
jgi:hypothetical protein